LEYGNIFTLIFNRPMTNFITLECLISMDMAGFFIIGIIINISVLLAFVIWAVKEWKKNNG